MMIKNWRSAAIFGCSLGMVAVYASPVSAQDGPLPPVQHSDAPTTPAQIGAKSNGADGTDGPDKAEKSAPKADEKPATASEAKPIDKAEAKPEVKPGIKPVKADVAVPSATLSPAAEVARDVEAAIQLKPVLKERPRKIVLKPVIAGQEPRPAPEPDKSPKAEEPVAELVKPLLPEIENEVAPSDEIELAVQTEDITTEGALLNGSSGRLYSGAESDRASEAKITDDGTREGKLMADFEIALAAPPKLAEPVTPESPDDEASTELEAMLARDTEMDRLEGLQNWVAAHGEHPRAAEAWIRLGRIRIGMGHAEPAAEAFESAREVSFMDSPLWADATLGLALTRAEQADYADAAESWAELARDDDGAGWAVAGEAWALTAAGDTEGAGALWEKLDGAKGDSEAPAPLGEPSAATVQLARALEAELAGDAAGARELYKAILSSAPASAEAPLARVRLKDLGTGLLASATGGR